MDERVKLLSYSSLLNLHSCPRKFQLHRLNAESSEAENAESEAGISQNVTFAFGHVVGDAIQRAFTGASLDSTIYSMFLGWHADLEDRNIKQNKSFYHAVAAIQRFYHMREQGLLDGYELLCVEQKPATELSFRISFPDGFKMRGSVDAVLRHTESSKIVVLEVKTSSATNINPATYKNSSQGIGYSVVLDAIAPEISSYDVMYLVYLTKSMDYEMYSFPKSYLQRALWIQELLLDIETIKLYENAGVYPMRGESCLQFFRECEYLNVCTLNTEYFTKKLESGAVLDSKIYDVEISLMDLLQAQMEKNEVIESNYYTGDLIL